jgi:S-DNA-T family DNA segregation ATPase FtsK/SpoIIIE
MVAGSSVGGNGTSWGGTRVLEAEAGHVTVRLTVADPSRTGALADVEVTAARGTPLSAVRGDLLEAVGRGGSGAAEVPLFVDGQRADGLRLGGLPLIEGAVVTVGRAGGVPGRGAGTAQGLVEVHVTSGPGSGERHPLSPGVTRVGRGDGADIRLPDPEVSRTHVSLEAVGAAVLVRDLGSTNGTRLGSEAVTAGHAARWTPGESLLLGGCALALRPADGDPSCGGGPAAVHEDGAGRLLVNPAPRLRPPALTGRVDYPRPPAEAARSPLPWAGMLLPLALCVPLALLSRQPAFVAFALLSPVTMIAQHCLDRRRRRGEHARLLARHAEEVARADAERDRLLAAERAALHACHLDPAAAGATAAGPSQRLWERRDGDGDELALRLGIGDTASTLAIGAAEQPGAVPVLAGVPIVLDLAASTVGGVAGLSGPRREVLALARSLVGQAAVANSPRHLRIAVLAAGGHRGDPWCWTTWIPHAVTCLPTPPRPSGARGPALPRAGRERMPRLLVVLDGAERLRRDPRVAALLAAAGDDVFALCLDDDSSRLPAECGATIAVGPAGWDPGAVLTVQGGSPCRFSPDLTTQGWADRLGRDLARLADATPREPGETLPGQVCLLDLLLRAGDGLPASGTGLDAAAIAEGWSRSRAARAPATTALAGVTADGPWLVDLARQGPHALVAGTTGSGKSELLTTIITSLAVSHPPDRLQVLLVDYKGGTAFGPLGDLPHAVGVLTDLDAHLARRALASLNAELRRRERLLAAAGVCDLDSYERLRPAPAEPLPRLVVVVDEFRVLSEELPDLVNGLVRVAGTGRSLGVHLILATQRPAGVVTAEMRANLNLRIALRVRDGIDSDDVVGCGDAAAISADRPGRGILRTGGGPLVEFQAARASCPPTAARVPAVRRLRRDDTLVTAWRREPHAVPADLPPTVRGGGRPSRSRVLPARFRGEAAVPADDLAGIVAACRTAAHGEGLRRARPPWLPHLPEVIRPTDVTTLLGTASPGGTEAGALLLGVVDLPEAQARRPLTWSPSGQGHLAVVGAPGTGRTGVIRAVAGAAGRVRPPLDVHIVDGGGRLGDLDGLAHVGTVVPVTDVERAARLLARLVPRRVPPPPGGENPQPVLLLVDGWEQLLDTWLPVEHGRLVDDLVRLARTASGAGVRLAVSGGRALLSGPLSDLLAERLLLRAADPADLVLAGVRADEVPAHMPCGRVVEVLPGGHVHEAQVVLDDPVGDPAIARGAWPEAPGGGEHRTAPLRLPPLPDLVTGADLLAVLGDSPSAVLATGIVPLGLGGDDVSPLGPPTTSTGWLVAGAPGTGRSTTLTTAVTVLRAAGRPVVIVADPGSPLASAASSPQPAGRPHGSATVLSGGQARAGGKAVITALDDVPEATLVVDDVRLVADPLLEEEILARLDGMAGGCLPQGGWPAGPTPHLLAGTTPGEAAVAFRGVTARLRSCGTAVLLSPTSPGDGEAFGVRVPVSPGAPVGRAVVVGEGSAVAVQIAGTSS